MRNLILTLGWLFVLFLACLLAYGIWPSKAHASGVTFLVLTTYDSGESHTLSLRKYIDTTVLYFDTPEQCDAERAYAASHFNGKRDPETLGQHLLQAGCYDHPPRTK